jgi:hypothetical protein
VPVPIYWVMASEPDEEGEPALVPVPDDDEDEDEDDNDNKDETFSIGAMLRRLESGLPRA